MRCRCRSSSPATARRRRAPPRYPWTMGFLQNYAAKARSTAATSSSGPARREDRGALREHRRRQGHDAGLKRGIAGRAAIVATQAYEFTDNGRLVADRAAEASGADTLMLFATPKFVIQAFVAAHKLGWKPQLYVASSRSSRDHGDRAAQRPRADQGRALLAFVKNPNDRSGRDKASRSTGRS